MNTSQPRSSTNRAFTRSSPLPFIIGLAAIILILATFSLYLAKDAVEKLKAENKFLATSNNALQQALLQINPQSLMSESIVGLQEQDNTKDSGTLTELFKVGNGVFYGIVYKDKVNGYIPVWFFGTEEPPKRGSTVSLLHRYVRFKGGTDVLAFSKIEPNL